MYNLLREEYVGVWFFGSAEVPTLTDPAPLTTARGVTSKPNPDKPFYGFSKQQFAEISAKLDKDIKRKEILLNLYRLGRISKEEVLVLDPPGNLFV